MDRRSCVLLAVFLVLSLVQGEEPKVLTGRCHCGQITYEAQGPIVNQSYCDCPGCQKASGTLKAPFVTVSRAKLTVKGEPKEFRARSGAKCDAHGVWLFCPTCGTHLFWKANEGDHIDIFAGTLDDTKVFQPKEK